MAVMTYGASVDARHTGDIGRKSKSGFWGRMFQKFIESRENEARRRIAVHLSHIPDEQLCSLGLGAEEIVALRHGRRPHTDI